MKYETLLRRITKYGYTDDEAMNCPVGTPLWIYRIERELGEPLERALTKAAKNAKRAKRKRITLKILAEEWGVKYAALRKFSSRHGISFPNIRNGRKPQRGTS